MVAERNAELVRRVGRALLAMQRHHWEHGAAAQAFLESGETDLVVVMARDAVQRQLPDGRLAMIGDLYNSNDAAAPGEAVIYAAHSPATRCLPPARTGSSAGC